MKFVVTGVSGLVGRTTAALLAGQGHRVIGISRSRPLELPRDVEYVAMDVRDRPALEAVCTDADAVLHCAFMLDGREGYEAMRAVNLEGTTNVARAAEAAGVTRLVFVSSATVYGPRSSPDQPPSSELTTPKPHPQHPYARQKLECEQVVAAAAIERLSVRASIILGRGTDNRLQEAMVMARHLAATGPHMPWQLMHHDDVARFLVQAVQPGQPQGVVNIAADGVLTADELALVVGRKAIHVPGAALYGAAKLAGGLLGISPGEVGTSLRMPVMDTTRMREEFGFDPAWTAVETAEDTLLAVHGNRARRGRVVAGRGRVPYRHQILAADTLSADDTPLSMAGARDAGEFDTPIDPRFPVYSQTNLAEALPGPSSPLTIDVMARALRGTTSAVADLLKPPAVLHVEASARLQGIFAHRFFINASGTYQVGVAMPGTDPDQLIDQYAGRHVHEIPGGRAAVVGTYSPPAVTRWAQANHLKGVALDVLGAMRGAAGEIDRVVAETARLERLVGDAAALSDARLQASVLLARDLLAYAWTIQGLMNLVAGAALSMATRKTDSQAVGLGDQLASSAALRGVHALAAEVATSPTLTSLLASDGSGLARRVAESDPAFWGRVRAGLDEFGHRGPGEVELDGRSFADDVDSLLRTVLRASTATRPEPAPALRARSGSSVRRARRMLALRERNRDRCVRLAWVTRHLVLEQGRRLVTAGRLNAADDVFYLTVESLLDPPPDAQGLVTRRREERDRLREVRMPAIFDTQWAAAGTRPRLEVGDSLQGIGISAGLVKGRVRLVDQDTVDDFEDDEILVAHVTDVGYTPLFALAGAVITDIGGEMSHAAVVAREFAVPCVVDTQEAALLLRTGDLVEVDGEAGTVRLLERGPAPAGVG